MPAVWERDGMEPDQRILPQSRREMQVGYMVVMATGMRKSRWKSESFWRLYLLDKLNDCICVCVCVYVHIHATPWWMLRKKTSRMKLRLLTKATEEHGWE